MNNTANQTVKTEVRIFPARDNKPEYWVRGNDYRNLEQARIGLATETWRILVEA